MKLIFNEFDINNDGEISFGGKKSDIRYKICENCYKMRKYAY